MGQEAVIQFSTVERLRVMKNRPTYKILVGKRPLGKAWDFRQRPYFVNHVMNFWAPQKARTR